MGRPKVTGRVRVNWIVNEKTKMKILARVKRGDRERNSPGKVIDRMTEETDAEE